MRMKDLKDLMIDAEYGDKGAQDYMKKYNEAPPKQNDVWHMRLNRDNVIYVASTTAPTKVKALSNFFIRIETWVKREGYASQYVPQKLEVVEKAIFMTDDELKEVTNNQNTRTLIKKV